MPIQKCSEICECCYNFYKSSNYSPEIFFTKLNEKLNKFNDLNKTQFLNILKNNFKL